MSANKERAILFRNVINGDKRVNCSYTYVVDGTKVTQQTL